MTSLFVSDFKLGLDVRKGVLTAEPGSLRTLDNAVITPGGEVQKRMAFVQVASLPAGQTQGLHGTNTGAEGTEQLYVFQFGTAGASVQLASIALTDGDTVPLISYALQTNGGTEQFVRVRDVAEYGPQQFFVTGDTCPSPSNQATTLRNWWDGAFVPAYVGYAPLVSGQKMYRVLGPALYFSGVGDPSVTNPLNPAGDGPNTVNPGAGFIDTSRIDSDSNWLIGMEAYYKQVALFSRRVCLLFTLDPDLANNTFQQLLRIGAVSNGSILQFGTGDVLFLSDNGVRSLRVLNASLAAGVTDVGSPIDTIIQAAIKANPSTVTRAEAIIDPISGRYWLAIGNTIYVLSYWPSSKINAWSTFTLPFSVDHMTVAGTHIFIRSGDNIYLFGGYDGATYDTCTTAVRTPHMAAETPTTEKTAVSVGVMASGTWSVSAGMAPDNTAFYEPVATLTNGTYGLQRVPYVGVGTHIGFTLTCNDAGPSVLGGLAARFEKGIER